MMKFVAKLSCTPFLCLCLLLITPELGHTQTDNDGIRVLMQLEVPPASCVAVEGQNRNLVIRHLKRRDRSFRPRALINRLRNQIQRFRSIRQASTLQRQRQRLRNRIRRLRGLIQFARQCPDAELVIPDPEPTPPSDPEPIIEPEPVAPGYCESVHYSFLANSAPINGDGSITFYFREAVPCGQFVDGTWWVEGPVQIRRITPDSYNLIPEDISTFPSPMLQALRDYYHYNNSAPYNNRPLCHFEPVGGCITEQEMMDFFISDFNFAGTEGLEHFRNGYMIDPVANDNQLDPRLPGFTKPEVSLPLYNSAGEEIPNSGHDIIVDPTDRDVHSVIKAASRHDIRYGTGWGTCNPQNDFAQGANRGCLNSVAILTVVSRVPESDAFRPTYYGLPFPKLEAPSHGGNYFRSSQLKLDRLPELPHASLPQPAPNIEQVTASFSGPWTFFFNTGIGTSFEQAFSNLQDRNGNFMHYHSSIANAINVAMLRTMHDDPVEVKRPLVEQVVQRGIDYYYGLVAGKHYSSGTGFNQGFKSPILYAGYLLDEPLLLNLAQDFHARGHTTTPNGLPSSHYFAEDSQTFFGADVYNGKPVAIWGETVDYLAYMDDDSVDATTQNQGNGIIVPIRPLYDDFDTMPTFGGFGGFPRYYQEPYVDRACGSGGNRAVRDPKGQRHGGYWVALNLEQRPPLLDGNNNPILNGNGDVVYTCPRTPKVIDVIEGREPAGASAYQFCCSSAPMVGSYTTATLMGLREEWGHEPFFEYSEQWVRYYSTPGSVAGNYGDSYIRNMLFTYASPLDD